MVEIIGQDGEKIGRGLVESSSKDIEQYKSQNITKRKQPIIHYDNLVMF
jgi:glutamate 5-kinase